MLTLRLVEPNGYSVPGGLVTVAPAQEAQARADLKALAAREAAQWADFGYHPGDYRILTDPADHYGQ
jgi:hypothetical protein